MRTLLVLVVAAGGAGRVRAQEARPRHAVPRSAAHPVVVHPGDTEEGIASWYGHPYHGRAAANGEIYDMEKMTAAHRTLPFNTWVRVYDLDNNKTIDVRITDRGPFVDGRIIDLSHAAARELEMIGPGTARVRIEVIRAPPDAVPGAVRGPGGRLPRPGERRAAAQPDGGALRLGAAGAARRESGGVARAGGRGTDRGRAPTRLAERIRQESVEKNAGFVVRIDSAT